MRWIWIDKFLEFRSGQFARAIKNLTLAAECAAGTDLGPPEESAGPSEEGPASGAPR